jgi:pimeloyl-ACP methyl ester carboxylesterase
VGESSPALETDPSIEDAEDHGRTIRSNDENRISKNEWHPHEFLEAGEEPLVFLLHGFPELGFSWRHQISALADAGYRVVAPDQRGYGQTDRPENPEAYTLCHLAADVVGLLESLGESRAAVIGHDWGSGVTWTCALLRPDCTGWRFVQELRRVHRVQHVPYAHRVNYFRITTPLPATPASSGRFETLGALIFRFYRWGRNAPQMGAKRSASTTHYIRKDAMPDSNVFVLRLTNEQQDQIRKQIGKKILALRIEAVEERANEQHLPAKPVRALSLGLPIH